MDKKKTSCPICDKSSEGDYAPFCSRRCADVDLHRWLSGNYSVPAREEDDMVEGAIPDNRLIH